MLVNSLLPLPVNEKHATVPSGKTPYKSCSKREKREHEFGIYFGGQVATIPTMPTIPDYWLYWNGQFWL